MAGFQDGTFRRRLNNRKIGILVDHFSICSHHSNTVNSEIFARVLFSRNFVCAKLRDNKILAKWRSHSVVY